MACERCSMSCSLCPWCGEESCPHLHNKKPKPIEIEVTLCNLRDAIKRCFSLYHFRQVQKKYNKTYNGRWNWFADCQKGQTLEYIKDQLSFMFFLHPSISEIQDVMKTITYYELTRMYGYNSPYNFIPEQ